jgi:hypothetical protein
LHGVRLVFQVDDGKRVVIVPAIKRTEALSSTLAHVYVVRESRLVRTIVSNDGEGSIFDPFVTAKRQPDMEVLDYARLEGGNAQ